jgi:hypothetical protein
VSLPGSHTFNTGCGFVDNIGKTPEVDELRKRVFCDALSWTEEEGGSVIVGGKDNRVVGPSLPAPLRVASAVVYLLLSSFFSRFFFSLIDTNMTLVQPAERNTPNIQYDNYGRRAEVQCDLWSVDWVS